MNVFGRAEPGALVKPVTSQKLVAYKPKRKGPREVEPVQAIVPTGVLAARPDLAEEAAAYVRAAKAPATRRAYASDWGVFRAWCATNGEPSALPAAAETVAAFITEKARDHAPNTLKRYLSSISKGHKLAGHRSPAADHHVRTLLEGILRTKGAGSPRAKDAFTGEMMGRAIEAQGEAPEAQRLRAARDKALVLVGLHTAARRSELCAFRIESMQWVEQGVLATIARSKTDQHGKGRVVAIARQEDPEVCPVHALRVLIDLVGETEGPIFRGFKNNGKFRTRALSEGEVALIVKRYAVAIGLDGDDFAAHSLRAGYVTTARLAGIDWGSIMQQTGHKKAETAMRYMRGEVDMFTATRAAEVFGKKT